MRLTIVACLLAVAAGADEVVEGDKPVPTGDCHRALCVASCCHFSEPKRECGGCDPEDTTMECRPHALCFETGSAGAPSAPETMPKLPEGCSDWCWDTPGCCGFADPKADCSGCTKEFGCNPEDACYPFGRNKPEL